MEEVKYRLASPREKKAIDALEILDKDISRLIPDVLNKVANARGISSDAEFNARTRYYSVMITDIEKAWGIFCTFIANTNAPAF